jgi:hypothetical protein
VVADGVNLFTSIPHVAAREDLMDTTPLGAFASTARASNRLLYADLRRLRRDILPSGARTREEVEALLSLDGVERVDEDWPRYLARTVTEFVLATSDSPPARPSSSAVR